MPYDISSEEYKNALSVRLGNIVIKAKQVDNLIRCIGYTQAQDKGISSVIGFETVRALNIYRDSLQETANETEVMIQELEKDS